MCIGKKVNHTKFGEGVISSIENDKVTIKFDEFGDKTLQYPGAFLMGLEFEDAASQKAIEADALAAKAAKEAARQEEIEGIVARTAQPAPSVAPRRGRDIDAGFGPDYHAEHLRREPILTYSDVETEYGIRITGFGKGINPTPDSVVLISSVDPRRNGFVYQDHWTPDGDYIYSGEGSTGDQKMTAGNAAIRDARADGKPLHLFVKFAPDDYRYQGVVELVDVTYEDATDCDGNTRKEYKFRLRKVSE